MRLQISTFNPTYGTIFPLALQYLEASIVSDLGLSDAVELRVQDYPKNLLPLTGSYRLGITKLLSELHDFRPDMIALSCYMWNVHETLLFCDSARAMIPDVYIVLGGPEVSGGWGTELMRRHSSIDLIVQGEGERTFLDALRSFVRGEKPQNIPGTVWRDNGTIRVAGAGTEIKPLDSIPSPWNAKLARPRGRDVAMMETYRGCPQGCAFCQWGSHRVRLFSLDRIERELKCISELGIGKIEIIDPMFGPGMTRIMQLTEMLGRHDFNVYVALDLNFITLTRELIEDFIDAGVVIGNIGLQSTNEKTLKVCGRTWKKELFEKNFALLAEHYPLAVDLISGLPEQLLDDVKSSIRYSIEQLKAERINLFHLYLLPGSTLRDESKELKIRYIPQSPHIAIGHDSIGIRETLNCHALQIGLRYFNMPQYRALCRALARERERDTIDIIGEIGDFMLQSGAWTYEFIQISQYAENDAINWRRNPAVIGMLDRYDADGVRLYIESVFPAESHAGQRARALALLEYACFITERIRCPAVATSAVPVEKFESRRITRVPSLGILRSGYDIRGALSGSVPLSSIEEEPVAILAVRVKKESGNEEYLSFCVPDLLGDLLSNETISAMTVGELAGMYTDSVSDRHELIELLREIHAKGMIRVE